MNLAEYTHHKVIQGTEEWHMIRLGRLTGSTFPDIMPSEKARKPWTDTQLAVLRKVAAEQLTGERVDIYPSKEMIWGTEQEPFARDALSDYLLQDIHECGIFTRSDLPMVGDSPDGIVGDMCGVVEIKCPASHTHVLYLNDKDELWKKYRWQVLGHMLITGVNSAFLCSYDPRMPSDKKLVVCEPTTGWRDDMKKLELRLRESTAMIEEWVK